MEFNLADLSRRLENMIRLGTIAEVRHSRTPQVRVQLGSIVTNWLPVTTAHAGNKKTWCPPSPDEQCIVFSPSGDIGAGIVIAGLNSKHQPAPDDDENNTRTVYPDGAVIDYNHTKHTLVVNLPEGGSAMLTVPGSVVVKSDGITLDTQETVCTGSLLVKEGIHAEGDITSGNISLCFHSHMEQGNYKRVGAPL